MDPFADIDLDAAAVWLDGAWYTREALARRIKEMIEAGDFRVSRPSQALERLEAALAASRVVPVRMPAELAASVEATAARLDRPVGHLIREAVAYYLAAAEAYVAQAEAAAAHGGDAYAQGEAAAAQGGEADAQGQGWAGQVEAYAAQGEESAAEGELDPSPPAQREERPGEGGAASPATPGSPTPGGEGDRSS